MFHELGQIARDTGNNQLHAHRAVGKILDQFGDVAAEIRRLADVEFIQDDQHAGANDLGEHIRNLTR